MKYEIILDADKIRSAIEDADGDNADNLALHITVEVDKNGKAKATHAHLVGEITDHYVSDNILY